MDYNEINHFPHPQSQDNLQAGAGTTYIGTHLIIGHKLKEVSNIQSLK